MSLSKKRVFSLLLAFCLVFAFTACGGDSSDDVTGPMDKDTYLEKVDGLNDAAGEFVAVGGEFISVAATQSDDEDAIMAAIEKIRDTKQPFLDFGAIDNPPEGYEDAHAKLADCSTRFGECIDTYSDILVDTINGVENEAADTIQTDVEAITNELSAAMTEVQSIE